MYVYRPTHTNTHTLQHHGPRPCPHPQAWRPQQAPSPRPGTIAGPLDTGPQCASTGPNVDWPRHHGFLIFHGISDNCTGIVSTGVMGWGCSANIR